MQHLPLQHPHAEVHAEEVRPPSNERERMIQTKGRKKEEKEWIGESLFDPRNGSSTDSKKERGGAGVAAAWQLPPTWDSTPRFDSSPLLVSSSPFLVVVIVVVVVVAAGSSVTCQRSWPYVHAGIHVHVYTWETRRLSHVCANLVIRPPPGRCLVARPPRPTLITHAKFLSAVRSAARAPEFATMDRSRHAFRGTGSSRRVTSYWIIIFVSRLKLLFRSMYMNFDGFHLDGGDEKSTPFSRARSAATFLRNVLRDETREI